jgi:ClpP class serine protease
MKLQRVFQSFYFEPWSISPQGWQAVHAVLKPHLDGSFDPAKIQARRHPDGTYDETTDYWGNPMPKLELNDGIAVVPVIGTLLHHADLLDKQCGACSYDDIKRDIRTALDVGGLRKIVLHINSPGGMSLGNDECAAVVAEAAQWVRVEAITDAQMCSAAYAIAAPATAIYCTPTAMVGCIGCYLAWLDQKVRYEMAGVSVKLFTDGKYKGAGTTGTELTKVQEDYFQSLVDKYGGMFKSIVRSNRPVDEEAMQGQVFIGDDGLRAGIVDRVMLDVMQRCDPDFPDED